MQSKFSKKVLLTLIIFFIGINIFIIFIIFLNVKKLSINLDTIHKLYYAPILVVSLMCIYYMDIIIHEIGHFLAGCIVKFKLHSFSIFPFMIEIKNGKKIVRTTNNFGQLGSCIMYPNNFDDVSMKLILYYLGGIILNFISIIIVLFLMLNLIDATTGMSMKIFFSFFLINSEFNLIGNCIPRKINNSETDGLKVIMLMKQSYLNNIELIELMIIVQLLSGTRPKEIDMKMMDDDNLFNGKFFFGQISIYWIYYYLDTNDIKKIEKCFGVIEKNIDRYSENLKLTINYEILYYYSYIKKNINKANDKHNIILKRSLKKNSINNFRAEMAYELYINKDYKKARQLGISALLPIKKEEIIGIAIFEEMEIRRMLEEIKNCFI